MRFASRLVSLLLPLLLIAVFSACDGSSGNSRKIGHVEVVYGADQCAFPGEAFRDEIRVKIRAAADDESTSPGKLPALAGEPVRFEVVDGSDLEIVSPSEETDIVGEVHAKVRAGHRIGDNYVRIVPQNSPDKFVLVRLVVGAKIGNADREGATNGVMGEPLTVTVVDAEGRPVEKAPVYFSVKSAPRGKSLPKVLTTEALTNELGQAQTMVRLGSETGEYHSRSKWPIPILSINTARTASTSGPSMRGCSRSINSPSP